MQTNIGNEQEYPTQAGAFHRRSLIIQRFKIENETDADFFLKDLLAKDENRSVIEIIVRANNLISDETLRMYFIGKGKQMLEALAE